jgi:hypothetical protein
MCTFGSILVSVMLNSPRTDGFKYGVLEFKILHFSEYWTKLTILYILTYILQA